MLFGAESSRLWTIEEFVRNKYKFAGRIHCNTLKSLAEAQQRTRQLADQTRARPDRDVSG